MHITPERGAVEEPSFTASSPGSLQRAMPLRAGRVALVGCVKKKLGRAAPASELYISPLFQRQKEWAIARCGSWLILSAKYGVVRPDSVIDPYEMTLKRASAVQKRTWSAQVLRQLQDELGRVEGLHFEIYAGKDYFGYGLIEGLRGAGATVQLPWQGLGLGKRLALTQYASDG